MTLVCDGCERVGADLRRVGPLFLCSACRRSPSKRAIALIPGKPTCRDCGRSYGLVGTVGGLPVCGDCFGPADRVEGL